MARVSPALPRTSPPSRATSHHSRPAHWADPACLPGPDVPHHLPPQQAGLSSEPGGNKFSKARPHPAQHACPVRLLLPPCWVGCGRALDRIYTPLVHYWLGCWPNGQTRPACPGRMPPRRLQVAETGFDGCDLALNPNLWVVCPYVTMPMLCALASWVEKTTQSK